MPETEFPTFERQLPDGLYLIAEIIPDRSPHAGPGLHIAVYPREDDSITHTMGMIPTSQQLKAVWVDLVQWIFSNIDQEQPQYENET